MRLTPGRRRQRRSHNRRKERETGSSGPVRGRHRGAEPCRVQLGCRRSYPTLVLKTAHSTLAALQTEAQSPQQYHYAYQSCPQHRWVLLGEGPIVRSRLVGRIGARSFKWTTLNNESRRQKPRPFLFMSLAWVSNLWLFLISPCCQYPVSKIP
jgi:hypothetical protein